MTTEPTLQANTTDTPFYWECLGRFVHAFAECEKHFAVALLCLVDGNFRVSGPIIADMQLGARIILMGKIFSEKRRVTEQAEDCERVLKQMRVISTVRNLLLHNGTVFSADGATTSKLLGGIVARGKQRPKPTKISVKTLQAMTADCGRISHYWHIQGFFVPPELAKESAAFRPKLHEPWNYKA